MTNLFSLPTLHNALLLACSVLISSAALAQQPVRLLPKVEACPLAYDATSSYCVPSSSGNTRGAIEKVRGSCPLGFYASGNYCAKSR